MDIIARKSDSQRYIVLQKENNLATKKFNNVSVLKEVVSFSDR